MGNRKNQLTQKEADKIFQRLKKKAQPSEKLKKYVHNTLLADHHYMFQFKAGRQRFGHCSACGSDFNLETKTMRTVTPDDEIRLCAKHGEKVCCPVCGRTVTKWYAGYPHKKIYAMAGECRVEKNGVLVIYTYTFSYDYNRSFRAKQEWCLEQICYFDIHRYFQLLYGYGVRVYTGDKYSNDLNFTATQSAMNIFNYSPCFKEGFHLIGFKETLEKSNLKYSCADVLMGRSDTFQLASYLKFYCSYPVITERLVKEGHAGILMSYINGGASGLFKFNKQTVPEFFGLDKVYYNFLRGLSVQPVNSSQLRTLQFMKRNEIPVSKEYFDFVSAALNYKKELDLMLKFRSFRKCVSYAKKQSLLCGCAYSYATNVTHNFFMTYRDYVSAGKRLNYDFTSESVVFPQNISIAHQEQIEFGRQQKREEEKRKYKNFEKRLKRLRKKYTFSDGKLLIRPAESSDELLAEGNELHHCVYSCYKDRYMKGDTDILFIRNCQEPDKPFYTLEFQNGHIIQCRTYHNEERTPEVSAFLADWQSFLKSNKAKHKKREVA